MTNQLSPQEKDFCQKLFRQAFNGKSDDFPADGKEHLAADLDFLEALYTDSVTPEEKEAFIRHLAECPACRRQIARQAKCGLLFADSSEDVPDPLAPEEAVPDAETVSSKTSTRSKTPSQNSFPFLYAAAALFVAVGALLYWNNGTQKQIELARLDLAALQNERQDVEPFAGYIPDLGYRLSGTSLKKGLSMPESQMPQDPLAAAYERLLRVDVKNNEARIEYAAYLLGEGKSLDRAAEILQPLAESDKKAELMLGAAEFLKNRDDQAQRHFRNVLAQDPENETALLDLAISLYRSGQREEAISFYREARRVTSSELIRQQIDTFLEKIEESGK